MSEPGAPPPAGGATRGLLGNGLRLLGEAGDDG